METFKKRVKMIEKGHNMLPEWLYKAERKLDNCNHLMELMRTFFAICTLVLQVIILCKLFGVI